MFELIASIIGLLIFLLMVVFGGSPSDIDGRGPRRRRMRGFDFYKHISEKPVWEYQQAKRGRDCGHYRQNAEV